MLDFAFWQGYNAGSNPDANCPYDWVYNDQYPLWRAWADGFCLQGDLD